MKRRILSLSLILTLWTCTAFASAGQELIQLLNLHSAEANFSQTIGDKKGKILQQSSGTMALQRPGKFRWEIKKPIAQLIVANGSRLWIYDPDLQQVTIRSLDKGIGETPALLLTNTQASIEKNFSVSNIPNNVSTMRWFLLQPKDENSMFTAIKVGFLNNQLHTMQLEDHLGHVTKIQFGFVKKNAPLAQTLFSFNPPKQVDVIDETKKTG